RLRLLVRGSRQGGRWRDPPLAHQRLRQPERLHRRADGYLRTVRSHGRYLRRGHQELRLRSDQGIAFTIPRNKSAHCQQIEQWALFYCAGKGTNGGAAVSLREWATHLGTWYGSSPGIYRA